MRVAIFAGREHHALKLKSIYDGLQERGHDPSYLIAQNSLNIDPASEFIWKYGEFSHAYEYLDGAAIERANNISRPLQEYTTNSELNKQISPFWISHSIREAAISLEAFRCYLDREAPNAVMILHLANFWGSILAYAAREREIPVFAYQEGLLRHSDQDTMNKQSFASDGVDIMFTWSTLDKDTYLRAGAPEGVVCPVGPFHLDDWIAVARTPQKRQEFTRQFRINYNLMRRGVVSFMPPMTSRYEGDIEKAVDFLGNHCGNNGLNLVIKFHPFDYNVAEQVGRSTKDIGHVLVYREFDPAPLMVSSDIVIGQHSTTGIESMFLGTLYVQMDLDLIGIEQPVGEGLPSITKKMDFDNLINNEFDIGPFNEWLARNGTLADGRATERALNIMEGMVDG